MSLQMKTVAKHKKNDSTKKRRLLHDSGLALGIVITLFFIAGVVAAAHGSSNNSQASTNSANQAQTLSQPQSVSPQVPASTYTPTIIGGDSPSEAAAKQCPVADTGTYPICTHPAPQLNCSGMAASSTLSFTCTSPNDPLIQCSGSIIGSIKSDNCDTQKGAPYSCTNNSIGSMIEISCQGQPYVETLN